MIALRVEQVPFAISFEDFAKHPAVTVRVAKLRVLQQALNSGVPVCVRKSKFGPQAAQAGGFRIAIELFLFFVLRRIVLLRSDTSCRRRSRCPTRSCRDSVATMFVPGCM